MTLEELEKRLRTLEDTEEIKKLQYRYIDCLNQCKWDDIADCFAVDGICEVLPGPRKGKAAITKSFKEEISFAHIGEEGLYCIHPIISIEGDKAKGNWLMYVQPAKKHGKPRELPQIPSPELLARGREGYGVAEQLPDWVQGYYNNEYVRENGEWKIKWLKWYPRLMSPTKDTGDTVKK